jgi:protein phosphatase PTC7
MLTSIHSLGDSGYIHLSPFRLNYLSPAQTHRFNTPFQLSKLPPKMLEQVALFGGAKPYSEVPSDAAQTTQQLAHGDVLVFATDGVWDNLSAEDALRLVTRLMLRLKAWVLPEEGEPQTCKPSNLPPNFREILENASIKVPSTSTSGDVDASVRGLSAVLATALTHEAKVASLDRKRDGPFAREVQRLYPDENWRGGKADDICVVVAVVCQEGM